jgi:ribonuclease P protein component
LRVRPNGLAASRAAVVAGKKLGGAVERNRAKRHLREALRPRFPQLKPGFDLVLIARDKLAEAKFLDIVAAVEDVLKRAHVL